MCRWTSATLRSRLAASFQRSASLVAPVFEVIGLRLGPLRRRNALNSNNHSRAAPSDASNSRLMSAHRARRLRGR
ncbi:hypothetical protein Cob_v005004 [Colletotrichum orbiculare MAFF 240422]|uniref:Uncharacterized protein n=1 Tax=Colletotrichum orbiculare (strain 104-T / ATCC 96160 / CBS 514.97 / LARS 414 / MAFF 240422) TaxID=1213857 RepID=A0A484FWD1_COLOR|nr:hypothetical protein Cob_v005004 [Colletotrichum orbiculare MAFF 240422]